MKLFFQCTILVLLLTATWASSKEQKGKALETPVRNFHASWTASCVSGTVVAMNVGEETLIVKCSPSSQTWKPCLDSREDSSIEISGLRVRPARHLPILFGPPYIRLGSHSLCIMTGLVSDVEHLYRVLERLHDEQVQILGKPLTTHALTMLLAEVLRKATFTGTRPFGVQSLIVGAGGDVDTERRSSLYSLGPAGTWQSWGRTTVIGRFAKEMRGELAIKRGEPTKDLKSAMEQIMECWTSVCRKRNIQLPSADCYEALVFQRKRSLALTAGCFVVTQDDVQAAALQAG